MYANEATVRRKARNVTANIDASEIEAIGTDVDSEIDGILGAVFYWPVGPNGEDMTVDLPEQILTIANLMTAGVLEQENFARGQTGELEVSPYGARLERQGRDMLKRIVEFKLDVPGLTAFVPVATQQASQSFFPVSGFSGGRARRSFSRGRGCL